MRSFGSYGWLLDMTLNPLVDVAAAIGRFLCCAPCSCSWVCYCWSFALLLLYAAWCSLWLHMQLEICWTLSLTCRFSADCLWCWPFWGWFWLLGFDSTLPVLVCSNFAGSGWLAWASLLVVAGLYVHIKLIQLWARYETWLGEGFPACWGFV
jgi:hypothetical protein